MLVFYTKKKGDPDENIKMVIGAHRVITKKGVLVPIKTLWGGGNPCCMLYSLPKISCLFPKIPLVKY